MFTVYILKSINFNYKTYVGFTSNIANRLISHNHSNNSGWTKRYQPWVIIYTEQFETKKEAMIREKYLKSGAGRRFIKEIMILK